MQNQYNNIIQLTSSEKIPFERRQDMLKDFAYEFQWHPSDFLELPLVSDLSTSHIIVEHGLENTAVISFLTNRRSYSDLNSFEKRRLLSISYNNLIDWHIHVERDAVTYVFNRIKNLSPVDRSAVSRDNMDTLRSENFDRLIGKKPNPNVPALDDALIKTISYWKRELSALLVGGISNESISSLFNAVIFVRAIEDHKRTDMTDDKVLLTLLSAKHHTVEELIFSALDDLGVTDIPQFLIDRDQLKVFDQIDQADVRNLISQFYRNDSVPYDYNFSLMSKHALSRVYEHYVSVLRIEEGSSQLRLPFFQPLPQEDRNKSYGSIYTPQYIARFFAKYLKQQFVSSKFRNLRTIDPAVGSGIFLRTLLESQMEEQLETVSNRLLEKSMESAVYNLFGVDIDENAVQATRLSLSLLNLVMMGSLPKHLEISSGEAIEYFQENSKILQDSFDVVVANPPFVSLDTQDAAMRHRIAEFMADHATGRIDTYLAFLRIGIELLKPGGFGLFVLPHSFLLSKSARGMRKLISDKTWIRCLADLSAIRVFEDSGIYVVLLIFQKKHREIVSSPTALIVKCQEAVGKALQDALDNQRVENNFYSIYEIDQSAFQKSEWVLAPPAEARIEEKLSKFPTLDEFLYVRVGFISGADDVFIVDEEKVPTSEARIFVPYLPDREMQLYKIPQRSSSYFFYPYIDGDLVSEDQLRKEYPETWKYLESHKERLANRGQVKKGNLVWWRPERPREPQNMMVPKIVSPHLTLVSRFSLDNEGKYAISRAPLLYPKKMGAVQDLLRYFVAVLNSTPCYWYIASHSHTYRGGYAMLEPKTLKKTPVPDPSKVPPIALKQLLELVDQRINAKGNATEIEIEIEIDRIVSQLYGLSSDDRTALGME